MNWIAQNFIPLLLFAFALGNQYGEKRKYLNKINLQKSVLLKLSVARGKTTCWKESGWS